MATLRREIDYSEATIGDVSDADPDRQRFYLATFPLVLGVFPAVSPPSAYWQLTTVEHIRLAQVAARMKPDLLTVGCELTWDDIGLPDPRGVDGGE